MRQATLLALVVAVLCSACTLGQEAAPPALSWRGCTGSARTDTNRLQDGATDDLLQCAAGVAAGDPAYRAEITHWLLRNRDMYSGVASPGYQAFVQTTELSFTEPQRLMAPAGWTLRDALPSADGRYVAAQLADGSVGWWTRDGTAWERHEATGYDLVWHPEEPLLAYISDGNTIHLIELGQSRRHDRFTSPDATGLRHPFWQMGTRPPELDERDETWLLALDDPAQQPQGVAYGMETSEWARFHANMTPQTWERVIVPPWISQPWNPRSGSLLTVWPQWLTLGQPDAGSPQALYRWSADTDPLSLTWSPAGLSFAVVERQADQLTARILPSFRDYDGRELRIRLEAPLIAVTDDGATTFSVSNGAVTAVNHLTGKEAAWRFEGEILHLRLGHRALLIVQTDRVIAIAYRHG